SKKTNPLRQPPFDIRHSHFGIRHSPPQWGRHSCLSRSGECGTFLSRRADAISHWLRSAPISPPIPVSTPITPFLPRALASFQKNEPTAPAPIRHSTFALRTSTFPLPLSLRNNQ